MVSNSVLGGTALIFRSYFAFSPFYSSSPGTNDVFNDDVWQAPDVESSVAPRMVPFNIALPTLTPGDVNLWTTDANCGKKFEFQVHEFVVYVGLMSPLRFVLSHMTRCE